MRLVLVIALVGCGDGPGEQTIRGEATFETFVSRMCACRDSTCATTVVTEFARWTRTIKKPREDPETARRLMDRYNACMADANTRR